MLTSISLLLRTAAGSWLTLHAVEGLKAGLQTWPPHAPCSPGTAGLSPTYCPPAIGSYPANEWNLSTDPDRLDPYQNFPSYYPNSEGFFKGNKTILTPDQAGGPEPNSSAGNPPRLSEIRPKPHKDPTSKTAPPWFTHFGDTCTLTPFYFSFLKTEIKERSFSIFSKTEIKERCFFQKLKNGPVRESGTGTRTPPQTQEIKTVHQCGAPKPSLRCKLHSRLLCPTPDRHNPLCLLFPNSSKHPATTMGAGSWRRSRWRRRKKEFILKVSTRQRCFLLSCTIYYFVLYLAL